MSSESVVLKMSDEPYAHETLVAKHQRKSSGSTIASSQDSIREIQADDVHSHQSESNESNVNITPSTVHDHDSDDGDGVPLAPAEATVTTMSCVELRCYLLEPMIFILLFAYNFSSTILKNQIIYQTCSAIFFYNESDCKQLGTGNTSEHIKSIETIVQPYAARIMLIMQVVQSILPAFIGIFIGAWSDRYGRKPLLLASFFGFSLQYISSAGIAHIANEQLVSPWYYVLTIVPLAVTGGSITYSVGAYCFIADLTTTQTRSYRMMCYEICIYMGLMIGSLTSGCVYEATNAVFVFSISAGSIAFALLIIVIFLPESLPPNIATSTTNQHNFGCAGILTLLKDFWRTCIKPRMFNDRSIIILVILTLLIKDFVIDGNNSVFYLFMREKFHWSVHEFTDYETISILVPTIAGYGGLLLLWLLRKCSNSAVLLLAIMSLLSNAASSLMKAFSYADWQIYSAIGLGVLKSFCSPMCRTIITNLTPLDERGKIFSLLSVLTTLVPFLSSTVYTIIYSITIISFPGFFNLLSANLFLVGIMLLLVICRKKVIHPVHYEPIFK